MSKVRTVERSADYDSAIARISWSLDAGNRSLRAEVDVPNENSALRPGMYATGAIELDSRDETLTLPTTAIIRTGAEAACMVVEDGKAKRRPVKVGLRVGPDVEIISGLTEDKDKNVVTVRPDAVADGQQVEILQATSSK